MRWAGADYHLGNVCMQSTLRVGIFRTQVNEKQKNLGVCIVVRRLLEILRASAQNVYSFSTSNN